MIHEAAGDSGPIRYAAQTIREVGGVAASLPDFRPIQARLKDKRT